jgi:hypothetical protein
MNLLMGNPDFFESTRRISRRKSFNSHSPFHQPFAPTAGLFMRWLVLKDDLSEPKKLEMGISYRTSDHTEHFYWGQHKIDNSRMVCNAEIEPSTITNPKISARLLHVNDVLSPYQRRKLLRTTDNSTSWSSRHCVSVSSRTVAGMVSRPASFEARYRRAPATSS